MRPLRYRSKLVVDGCQPDQFAAAFASQADSVMLENEDHVPPELKAQSRQWITDFLSVPSRCGGKIVQIRVNVVWSEFFHDDISALVIPGVDIIVLPKVDLPEHVIVAAEAIAKIERTRGLGAISLVATIETPKALRLAGDIARSHPRLLGLQLGYEDLFARNGINPDAGAADAARFQLKMASAEAGIDVYDGRYTSAVSDRNTYRRQAEQAAAMGFTGKTCSDEHQIAIANAVFRDWRGVG